MLKRIALKNGKSSNGLLQRYRRLIPKYLVAYRNESAYGLKIFYKANDLKKFKIEQGKFTNAKLSVFKLEAKFVAQYKTVSYFYKKIMKNSFFFHMNFSELIAGLYEIYKAGFSGNGIGFDAMFTQMINQRIGIEISKRCISSFESYKIDCSYEPGSGNPNGFFVTVYYDE